jgi:PncC family amidohydrolase
MAARSLSLAVAESCTGGLVSKLLTDPAGASAVLLGGVIAYADTVKERVLGVRPETLKAYGAVSEETAREMAIGVRERLGADSSLSITGIAGPSGGSAEKPVGTVWIGATLGQRTVAVHYRFSGDRDEIRRAAAEAALTLLGDLLRDLDD